MDTFKFSILPISIFVALPVLLWIVFMIFKWYNSLAGPKKYNKEHLERQSNNSTITLGGGGGACIKEKTPDYGNNYYSDPKREREGEVPDSRRTCANCDNHYWYDADKKLCKEKRSLPKLHAHAHSNSAPAPLSSLSGGRTGLPVAASSPNFTAFTPPYDSKYGPSLGGGGGGLHMLPKFRYDPAHLSKYGQAAGHQIMSSKSSDPIVGSNQNSFANDPSSSSSSSSANHHQRQHPIILSQIPPPKLRHQNSHPQNSNNNNNNNNNIRTHDDNNDDQTVIDSAGSDSYKQYDESFIYRL